MAARTNPANEPESERELTITRVFDAPARLVFAAWSKPEHIKRWFGPETYPVTQAEMDFRVGGKWRFAMTGPDGKLQPYFGGEYLEIMPERRIVFTDAFEAPDSPVMTMTVTFEEKDGKTTMTWRTVFPSAAVRKQYMEMGMEAGIASSLGQLKDLVGSLR